MGLECRDAAPIFDLARILFEHLDSIVVRAGGESVAVRMPADAFNVLRV